MRKQKSVYRAMILKLAKGMRKTKSPNINPSEYSPFSLPWREKALNVLRCYQAFSSEKPEVSVLILEHNLRVERSITVKA